MLYLILFEWSQIENVKGAVVSKKWVKSNSKDLAQFQWESLLSLKIQTENVDQTVL